MQFHSPDMPSTTPAAPLRVLIAEDHEHIRQAVASLLALLGCEVVGQAHDGREALELARALAPDLIVMDMSMPELAGPDVTRIVRRERPATNVVALSAHAELEWVEAALAAGAAGYVLKDVAFDDLPTAIETIHGGGHFVSSRIRGGAAALRAHLAAARGEPDDHA